MDKPLLTGGSGLLGQELQKYLNCYAPTHEEMDITWPIEHKNYSLIIHSAAYTDVPKAEVEKKKCYDINVLGTLNLVRAFPNTPLVFISTEYTLNPVNFYSLTKKWAEDYIKQYHKNYLIIRTLFKPSPFPFEGAFRDQHTQGDFVDVIAPLIVTAIMAWDGISKEIHLGTGRKTIYDLAKRTRNVYSISVDEIKDVKLPKDYLI